jgi:uncharacterized protein (TIGR01777 family)
MKIVVAGGTGFIGQPLVRAMVDAGHEVVVLSRHADGGPAGARVVVWDGRTQGAWSEELRGAGAVVNLAGASIGAGRWTESRKRALRESRLDSTGALVAAVRALDGGVRPRVFVSASGIDYYGDRGDEIVTEESGPGDTFLARLCVEWEAAAREAEALGVRVVLMRTSVVFGKGADALQRLALPFKLFAGGPLGSGRQWFPWIHLDDTIGLYRHAIEDESVNGPLNLVAPDVRREADIAKAVGRVLGRPSWAPAPAFALRLVLGELADLILHGRHAEPRKALAHGYQFKYPRLEEALRQALA